MKLVGIIGSALLVLGLGANAAAQDAAPVTITLMSSVLSAEVDPPPKDWVWSQAVKDALNIDVNINWVDLGNYGTILNTRAGTNDLPDVFRVATTDLPLFAPQGILGAWGPLLAEMPSYVEGHNVTKLAPIGMYNGSQYGLVTQTTFPYKGMVSVRQDWLEKLGLKAPKTTDEYLAVMKAFTTQDPDGNGRNDTYGWSGFLNDDGSFANFDPMFGAFDALGSWRVVDGQVTPVATSDNRRQALTFFKQMVDEGVVDPDWQTQTYDDFRRKWENGRIGLFFEDWCGVYCPSNFSTFADANPESRLVVIDPPVGPNGASAGRTYSESGWIYAVSQKAIDAGKGEAIARLFEWLGSDGYYLTAYGPEGECWSRGENGIIQQNDEDSCRQRRALAAWAYKGSDEEYRSRYATVTEQSNGQTVDVGKILERSYQYPRTDVTKFAVIPPAAPVVAADMQRFTAENELQFALGQKSLDTWDDYVTTLNGVGLEQYVSEANTAAQATGLTQ